MEKGSYTLGQVKLIATDPDFSREAILGSLINGVDHASRSLAEGKLEDAARSVRGLIEDGETGPVYFTDTDKLDGTVANHQVASAL